MPAGKSTMDKYFNGHVRELRSALDDLYNLRDTVLNAVDPVELEAMPNMPEYVMASYSDIDQAFDDISMAVERIIEFRGMALPERKCGDFVYYKINGEEKLMGVITWVDPNSPCGFEYKSDPDRESVYCTSVTPGIRLESQEELRAFIRLADKHKAAIEYLQKYNLTGEPANSGRREVDAGL